MINVIVIIVIAVGVLYGIKKMRKDATEGCCSPVETVKKTKVEDTDLSHYPYSQTFIVEDMHCSNCKTRIENAIASQDGCIAHADLNTKKVTIWSKEEKEPTQLKAWIARAGYTPKNA